MILENPTTPTKPSDSNNDPAKTQLAGLNRTQPDYADSGSIDLARLPEGSFFRTLNMRESFDIGRAVVDPAKPETSQNFKISRDEQRVSRVHAQIKRTADGFIVCDLGSTYGTYVNGEVVSVEGVILESGDVLQLAKTNTTNGPKYEVQIMGQDMIQLVRMDNGEETDQTKEPTTEPESYQEAINQLLSEDVINDLVQQKDLLRQWGWIKHNENIFTLTKKDQSSKGFSLMVVNTQGFLTDLNHLWQHWQPDDDVSSTVQRFLAPHMQTSDIMIKNDFLNGIANVFAAKYPPRR